MKTSVLAMAALAAGVSTIGITTSVLAKDKMSERAAKRLAQFEQTGEMKTCLNVRSINSMTALDDNHILVRTGVNDYYLNRASGCGGAARSGNRLQYTISGGNLCRNQIVKVVDNSSGFTVGSCGLGSFERLEKKPKEKAEEDVSG